MSRRSPFLLGGVVVPLLLSGCNSASTDRQRAELMEPPAVEGTLSRARSQFGRFSLEAWPDDQWWRRFHSQDLDKVMVAALHGDPGLKKSQARLNEAEALTKVEGARLVPFLDAELSMTQLRVPNHGLVAAYNPKLAGVTATMAAITPFSLRYEIDFWGKNRAALDAALGEAAAEEAEHAQVRLLLTTSVARTFIRGAALAQQLFLAQRLVKLRRELRDLAETRFRSGLDTADEVRQAAIDLEGADKRVALTEALLVLQQDLLARLMGDGPDSTATLFGGSKVAIPGRVPLPTHLPLELLAHRPDLAATMHRAEAAAERIHVAKAQFLPSVDLAALAGVQALTETNHIGKLASFLFRTSAFTYEAVPGLHLPLFEGGRLRGHLEVARSEYDEAVELYNETLLRAVQQVADSLSNLKQSRKILDDHIRLLKSQSGQFQLTRVRLRTGLNDRRESLRYAYSLIEQQFVLKELEVEHLSAMVDLIQALGGGYFNGVGTSRPQIDPEAALSGLETLTPAWILDDLASPIAPSSHGEKKE